MPSLFDSTTMKSKHLHPMIPTVYHPENANYRPCFGGQSDHFLSAAQTNGWLSAWYMLIPPDNGPPTHIHHREDEILIVMEGHFAFHTEGRWIEGGPGMAVYLPRERPHSFRNVGSTTGKICVLATPAGLESFFSQCEEPFHRPEGPDMEAITGIAEEHGIEFI